MIAIETSGEDGQYFRYVHLKFVWGFTAIYKIYKHKAKQTSTVIVFANNALNFLVLWYVAYCNCVVFHLLAHQKLMTCCYFRAYVHNNK